MINYNNVVQVIKEYLKKNHIKDFDDISDNVFISAFKYHLYIHGNDFIQSEDNIKRVLDTIKKENRLISSN